MKTLILILSVFLFVSCSSDKSNPVNNATPTERLVGSWLLTDIYVHYPTGVEHFKPQEYGNSYGYWKFFSNGRFYEYKKFRNHVYDYKGTFTFSGMKFYLKVEDPQKPQITTPITVDLKSFDGKYLETKAFAFEPDGAGGYLTYDAVLKYKKD